MLLGNIEHGFWGADPLSIFCWIIRNSQMPLKSMFAFFKRDVSKIAKWNPKELLDKSLKTECHASALDLESFIEPIALAKLSLALKSNQKTLKSLDAYVRLESHPGLPDWWHVNNNIAFVPAKHKGAELPLIKIQPGWPPPENSCLFLNGKNNFSLMLWGRNICFYVSEMSNLFAQIAIGGSFVFIGDNVRSSGRVSINCRNGGNIIMENDILMAGDVNLMSDDCHTIISRSTRSRLNPYGGSVWVKKHVWLSGGSQVMGNSLINSNCIVGARSLIRGISTPPNSILAGVPAKIVKTDVTWDTRDLPPDSPDIQKVL